VRITKIM